MASRIQRELALLMTGRDVSASKTARNVNRNVSRELGGLGKIAGKAGSNMSRNLQHGIIAGGVAAAGAGIFVVKQAMDWESAVAGVAKTIDGDVTQISKGILDMSRKIPIGAVELASLAEQAGALGVKKADILEFTRVAATLGVTTDVSALDAATALGQLGNVLGLTNADYERFGSTLVDLGNKGSSTESQILEVTRRAGAGAKLIGMASDATLGWAASFANLGMQPELAGTAMQSFFTKSLTVVNSSKTGLASMAKIAGKSAKAFKRAFDKDASGALEDFIQGLGKLPKDQRLKAVQELFGKTSGLTRGLLGLADSYDRNLAPSIDTASNAWKVNNAMSVEAEKRYATTASAMQILRNNVDSAAITIGSKLLPVLAELSKDAVGWIDEHQGDIEKFGVDLAAGVRDAVTWAKTLDWEAIGKGLQIAAGAAGTLVQAFADAPPWVQGFLTTGFLANKFTGGAVGDVLGAIAGGLVKGILGITAGVVNVNGPVAGGGVGGAAGKGGSVLGTIAKVMLVGVAAGVATELWGVKEAQTRANQGLETDLSIKTGMFTGSATLPEMQQALAGILAEDQRLTKEISVQGAAFQFNIDGVRDSVKHQESILRDAIIDASIKADSKPTGASVLDSYLPKISQSNNRIESSGSENTRATRATAQAIRDKDLSVHVSNSVIVPVTNNVRVSGRDVFSETVTQGIRTHQEQHSGHSTTSGGPF